MMVVEDHFGLRLHRLYAFTVISGFLENAFFLKKSPSNYEWKPTAARQKLTNLAFRILNHCRSRCKAF